MKQSVDTKELHHILVAVIASRLVAHSQKNWTAEQISYETMHSLLAVMDLQEDEIKEVMDDARELVVRARLLVEEELKHDGATIQ